MSGTLAELNISAKQVVKGEHQFVVRCKDVTKEDGSKEQVAKDCIWCVRVRDVLNESIQLVMVYQNGTRICKPVVTPLSKFGKAMEMLQDCGLDVYGKNLQDLSETILSASSQLPELIHTNMIGFHETPSGSLIFCGKDIVSFDDKTQPFKEAVVLDTEKRLKQQGDLANTVDFFNKVISNKVNAQIAVAVGLSAIIIGILKKQTLLLNLCGASSVGKTKFSELVASIYSKSDDNKIFTNFDSTDMAIETFMHGNRGMAIIIDDASTGDSKRIANFERLIYVLSKGIGRRRLNKNYTLNDPQTWYVSIVTSSEVSILKDVDRRKLGTLRRIIELNVGQSDLTTNADEAKEITKFIKANHGLLAPAFIMKLIESETLQDRLEELHEEEVERLQSLATADGISQGYAEMIASIILTAKLVDELIGIHFDADEMLEYLLENGREMIKAFKDLKGVSVPKEQAIKQLIEYGRQHCTEWNKQGAVNIPSREFTEMELDLGYSKNELREYLKSQGRLNFNTNRSDLVVKSNDNGERSKRVISVKIDDVE